MVTKKEVLTVMSRLYLSLVRRYPEAELTTYLTQTIKTLKKSDGVAFTGQYQYFLNHVPIVRSSDNLDFTKEEKDLWNKLMSLNELGNNLWAASL